MSFVNSSFRLVLSTWVAGQFQSICALSALGWWHRGQLPSLFTSLVSSGAALPSCKFRDIGSSRSSLPTGVASCDSENCPSPVMDRGLFGSERGVGLVQVGDGAMN